MMKKHKVVSLFSGCGGLDLGFHNEHFELVYAADNDKAAVKCLSENFKFKAKVIDVSQPEFFSDMDAIGSADIVLGGFPCQGFSKAGPKQKDDPRNILYTSMLKAVEKLRPAVFVAENVDGMAQNFNGEFVKKIQQDFQAVGYNVEYKILNAVDYGAPQYRRRIFFIGIRNSEKALLKWPVPTHDGGSRNGEFKIERDINTLFSEYFIESKTLQKPVSISDVISDLVDKKFNIEFDHCIDELSEKDAKIIAKIGSGQKLCNVRFSNTSVYTWNIPEAFGEVSEKETLILETIGKNRRKKIYGDIPNGNPLSIEVISELSNEEVNKSEIQKLVDKGYLKEINGKYDLKGAMFCSGLYKRPEWNEPSPTVITLFGKPRYFVHPKKNRPFTVRECARLQTFPDTFKFLESGISLEDSYRLIGNAVPPLLAEKIAGAVLEVLKSLNNYEVKKSSTNFRGQALRV